MRWGSPELLVLFLLLPILAVFLHWRWKSRLNALKLFGNMELVDKLTASIDRSRQIGKQVLFLLALFFLLVALLRPQFGASTRNLQRRGQDIIIALDLSDSMLAEDLKPNRLSKAKQEIKSLVNLLQGDRIGLVVFAGESQLLCPLTLDYGAAMMFLDEVDTKWLPTPGTDLARAIEVALQSFVSEEKRFKNLILITDGESHGQDPVALADKAATDGVTIYAVGIGQVEGVPIPVSDGEGRQTYKRDKEGNIVTTRLDIETLQQIAAKTGGRWHQASAGQLELRDIYEDIRESEDKELSASVTTIYEERFQVPLLIAMLILAFEMCLSDRKRQQRGQISGREGQSS